MAAIIGRGTQENPSSIVYNLNAAECSQGEGDRISQGQLSDNSPAMPPGQLAERIDHTLLKAEVTAADIRELATQAFEHRFAAVCVNPRWVSLASDSLAELAARHHVSETDLPAVAGCVGFPLGASRTIIKAVEATNCVKDGGNEIDMVIFLPLLLEGNLADARAEVMEVVRSARSVWSKTIVKVILETAILNEQQIAVGCEAAISGGADFVKTSTGFHPAGGATVEAVRLLKKHAGPLKVKASGGIRTATDAAKMFAAGADRIGCSASLEIMRQWAEMPK